MVFYVTNGKPSPPKAQPKRAAFSKSVSWSSMERNSVRQPMWGLLGVEGGGGFQRIDCQFVEFKLSKCSTEKSSPASSTRAFCFLPRCRGRPQICLFGQVFLGSLPKPTQHLPSLGQHWPHPAEVRPTSAECGPHLVDNGTKLAEFGPKATTIGPHLTRPGVMLNDFDRTRSNFGPQCGSIPSQIRPRPRSVEFGR